MPGIFGTIGARDGVDATAAYRQMVPPVAADVRTEMLAGETGGWALGRTHLGVLQPRPQLASGDSVHVLVHGDLYGDERAGSEDAAAVIAAAYRRHGADFVRHIDGAYCAAILDRTNRRVILTADPLGSYPLYWTVANGRLVFASELRALLKHPGVRREIDAEAIGDYMAFGFPFGTKTLASGVQLVAAGSAIVFDLDESRVTESRVVDIAEAFQPWEGSESDYFDALDASFESAVTRALSGPHAFGLSLSGGLDSRAILSRVNGHAGELKTYTLGVRGCADEVIATRLSRIAGTQHAFYALDDRYLRDFLPHLERMVSLTDGMYMSHGLTEMLALNFLAASNTFSVLLRGHGGELAKVRLAWPFHTDEQIYGFTRTEQLVPYLFDRVNYVSAGLNVRELFTDAWAPRIDGAALRSFEAAVEGVPLTPPDLCSYIYLTQHHRRSTIASLELFRQIVEVRMPFVDTSFLRVLFRAQPRWRDDTRIHRALTGRGSRRLLRVRNSNTGAPGNAGPLLEFALDKVNSLFKRLDVPGYRHYHNFQAWMREQLLSSVEAVLLSPASLDRGILRERGLRRLLDDTRAGRGDHSYLLQVLLILEIWQQQNL